jgi:dTDP-4-dehydrorhamnose 3,5-epimerase
MKFTEAPIKGAYIIDVNRIGDDRGYFGRLWCQNEFEELGLIAHIRQSNIGVNKRAGTLRGLHYQTAPHLEAKIVRCSRGAMFDVIIDLRLESSTFKQWFGMELTEENATMLYVPEGCATGYQTLVDDTEMYYHATEFYHPESATGVRFNDAAFGIQWPAEITEMSDNDINWPNFVG